MDTTRKDFLVVLLSHHMVSLATDIHIRSDNTVLYRQRGNLFAASNWERLTDRDGRLLSPHSFSSIVDVLLDGKIQEQGSQVFRSNKFQVRVQPLVTVNEKKLIIRIQPTTPPPLAVILNEHPNLVEHLANASGLVVVCGPIGSGKTTTTASIVSHWVNRRARHVATVEDPVEYVIVPKLGEISHFSCNLLGVGRSGSAETLSDILAKLQRSDIDGLFIGEVRDGLTRSACLDFAATREPVATTIHAGGFADAVLRLTKPEPGGMDQATLRLLLAQCLHAFIYVDMAYSEKGEPIPVILAAPGQLAAFRAAISESNPKTLGSAINQALTNCREDEGGVNANLAFNTARNAGATESSILAALPPDLRNEVHPQKK